MSSTNSRWVGVTVDRHNWGLGVFGNPYSMYLNVGPVEFYLNWRRYP